MRLLRTSVILSTLLAATLLLTACPSGTTISKINADPARYKNREVGLVGRVTDSYGIMGTGAYELDDGTGRIWVATTRGVPSKGSRVGVKGHVLTGFALAGRSFGTVLEETGRKVEGR
jgi:hypothetical protein